MGNVVGGGYAPTEAAAAAAGDDFVARLPDADLKRYTEGYRRICRPESGGGSTGAGSGSSSPSVQRSASSSPVGAIASAFMSKRPSHGGSATVAAATHAPAPGDPTVLALGSGVVSKKLFRSKLLGTFSMIPHSLSDRLFEVLDTERSGELTLENVLNGIAWLKHGTFEEQVQLLFIIYDLDGAGRVTRDVLDRFMDVIYGRRRARHATTVALLNRVFDGRASLSLDEFQQVVQEKDAHGDALLAKWLAVLAAKIGTEDDADILALEKKYNPVVIRHRIADATEFTTSEVAALERQFQRLFDAKSGASARVASDHFVAVLSDQHFPRLLLERFCASTALPQLVTFDEFCQFVSDFCRGTRGAKMRHLFRIYKDQDTGRVSLDALEEIIRIGARCDTESNDQQRVEDEEQQLAEISASPIADEGWDEQSFLEWAADARSTEQLVHQLAFAACLLVGVKPATPYLEKRIVAWYWKLATESLTVGQAWNLVAEDWWVKWAEYVGLDLLEGTPYGSLAIPRLPANAKVETSRSLQSKQMSIHVSTSVTVRPGPISNWTLLRASGSRRLKDGLVLGGDYYLVPSAVYSVLTQWYNGGPDLSRSVVETADGEFAIELFPLVLRVARVDPANGGVVMSGEEIVLSRLNSPDSLLEAACKALLLQKMMDKARLWYFNESAPDRKFRIRSETPRELTKLTQESVFLLEIQDDDGSWPLSQSIDKTRRPQRPGAVTDSDSDDDSSRGSPSRGANQRKRPRDQRPSLRTSDICSRGNLEALTSLSSGYSNTNQKNPDGRSNPEAGNGDGNGENGTITRSEAEMLAASSMIRKRFAKDAFKGPGLIGLDNLGNTCYMSSALQCLSHTRLLVEYFKNEAYLKDINLRNRDGTNGKLAVAFGELLRVLWTSEKKRFSPNEFKRILAKCHPQFIGSDQHDSQELLACLLSSLSEDLNRIMTKPYTEQPDSNGRNDALVAEEWWTNHLKREVSVIVALFTGQYKSLLECSVCMYESARFEPFTFLQLSLPESNYRSIVMTIIFCSDRVPMRYSVRVRNNDTIQDVKNQVAEFLNELERGEKADAPAIELVLARISTFHTIDFLLDGNMPLTQIPEKDQLSAFQLDRVDEIVPPPHSDSSSVDEANSTVDDTSAHQLGDDDGEQSTTNGSMLKLNGNHSSTVSDDVDKAVNAATDDNGGEASDDESTESDAEILPVGASVYVRIDKSKDLAAARVVGSSLHNGTINVAYPSGVRRYHIPLSKVVERRQDEAFIFLVHRRVERSMNSFTNAHITRLFGAPLVLRVSLSKTTAYNLYMLVWKRLRRIFNWETPPPPATAKSDSAARRTDTSCLALGTHLALTRFGFCLRMVTSHGIGCSRCEWIDGCLGCLLVPSADEKLHLAAEETIAIDWDIRSLKEEYDPIQASKLEFDDSVLKNRRQDNMPLNLDHCLEIFTAKENIQEAFCGRCRALRPATKKMDLWRLPPILVIQLKRFCYTQVSRRKLHHLVDFPLRGLDLEAYLAKKRETQRSRETGVTFWQFLGGKLRKDRSKSVSQPEQQQTSAQNGSDRHLNGTSHTQNGDHDDRGNGYWTALEAPAVAAVTADDGVQYDLYAVVNHVGALGGGHYFAYVLSETDGKWKCFNDHQCKDVDENEVVSSTAYILFYRRRDVADVPIEQLFPPMAAKSASATTAEGDKETMARDQAHVEELIEQSKAASSGGSGCTIS